jgi:hypothetical protein
MKTGPVYRRRVSSEEAREGTIMVLKNKLSFFPPPGMPFNLMTNSGSTKVKVESYECHCRGPEKPHAHFYLRWKNLRRHSTVSIRLEREGTYRMSLGKT